MRTKIVSQATHGFLVLASLFVLALNGCTFSINVPGFNPPTAVPPTLSGPVPTPRPSAPITFKVTLPTPLLQGEVLYLSVLDEVTGLGLNPVNHAMQGMDSLHYTVTIPFANYSIVQYRYMRQSNLPTLEDDSSDKAVRYRIYAINGPGSVEDIVSAWADGHFNSPNGRLTGLIVDSSAKIPIPNILIAAGGQQTLTDSNGRFNLEGLPAGTHNLVAYAIDGAYQTFQQGARVEAGKTTQVNLALDPAKMVSVTFTVSVPSSGFQNLPIRLAGNLLKLGDVFGDLQGGLNTVASRMPMLAPLPDGRYTTTLTLPVGADIRYKYTLGDGFWNAEHAADGSFVVRQMIVGSEPDPLQIQDTVQTWQAGPSSPILFEVTVPANTPVSDIVSIQFNPYGWTPPLPMWPRGNNQWVYKLYSPLNMLGNFEYRYCRNDQCGVADDGMTGASGHGRPVATSLVPEDIQDDVSGWAWYQAPEQSALVGQPVTKRDDAFWAGVELLGHYDPSWQAWMPLAIQDIKGRYANWLVLTPSWTASRTSPFVFGPQPGSDPLWADSLDTISHARASAMNVAIFPAVNLPADMSEWWKAAPRDAAWWEAWFTRYTAFADYHADMAQQTGAQALILGGDWVAPALPGGQVNGGSSGVPLDAETRWKAILADVHHRFTGKVLWAISYPGGLQSMPAFTDSLDGAYLLWNAPLSGSSVQDLQASAGQLLDTDIQPFQTVLGKPVILAAAYASANDSAKAMIPAYWLFQPGTVQYPVNLQTQADIYQALSMAVNERAWLGGFVSRGYYPPAALQDASASVHGKPAEDVLWYWFGRFTGKQ